MYDLTKAERDAIVTLLKVTAHADRERAKLLDRQVHAAELGCNPNMELANSFYRQAIERRDLAFKLEGQG